MSDKPSVYEKFDCAPGLKLAAHERVSQIHHDTLCQRLDRIEEMMERLIASMTAGPSRSIRRVDRRSRDEVGLAEWGTVMSLVVAVVCVVGTSYKCVVFVVYVM